MSIENENGNFAKPMFDVVLSLFDGMACGQIALNIASISYGKYYASEIDKHAIKVTQHNYPDTVQLGSVTDIKESNLWCDHNNIWSVFELQFGMNYRQISDFIKNMVEKHLNMKDVTPTLNKTTE